MKKLFVLCLFVVFSLGLFAQKVKSDGKSHFDKILWELWIKEVDADLKHGEEGRTLIQIVKIDKDYYFTDSYYPKEWKKNIKKTDRSKYEKLRVYKNIYLMDKDGYVYGYDLAKKKPVVMDKDLNIIQYYIVYQS
ncbi:hypothetical protein [Fusobacterium vincentii]|jgi:hypothetical protein|uniref:hypothetical protein n=1 Tax=Fusobacterium vincentii TaxID=155615 RepID=UPI0032505EE3